MSLKSSAAGGASGLAKYLAHSKVDEEREGPGARPLFSEHQDDLTYTAAQSLLSQMLVTKKTVDKADVIHLIISPAAGEYDKLGGDETERLHRLRALTRTVARVIAQQVAARRLLWVAAIHRNTEHPHIHLALSRDALHAPTGERVRLAHLPRALLPHHAPQPDGRSLFQAGLLAETFVAGLDQFQQQTRHTPARVPPAPLYNDLQLYQDRYLLGRAVVVEGRAAQMRYRLNALHQRRHPAPGQAGQLAELTRQAAAAQASVSAYQPAVAEITARYQAAGQPLPAPWLARKDVTALQEQAWQRGDTEAFLRLETIRQALAAERGQPARTPHEQGRLQAWRLASETAQQNAARRLREWGCNRHCQRYAIAGEEWSLVTVESRLARAVEQAQFITRLPDLLPRTAGQRGQTLQLMDFLLHNVNWRPSVRAAAAREVAELWTLRTQVEAAAAARGEELTGHYAATSARLAAVQSVAAQESVPSPEARIAAPRLRRHEYEYLYRAAYANQDISLLHTVLALEWEAHSNNRRGLPAQYAARLQARALCAAAAQEAGARRLQEFPAQAPHLPLALTNHAGQTHIATLAQVQETGGVWGQLLSALWPQHPRAQLIRQARDQLARRGTQLAQQNSFRQAARAALTALSEQARARLPAEALTALRPIFTTPERARLERYARNHPAPATQSQWLAVLSAAETPGHAVSSRPPALTPEEPPRVPAVMRPVREQPQPPLLTPPRSR